MKKILFCGGGALGSHALLLGRDLPHQLAVVDHDRVETKNLASQWFVKQMIGKPKATALKMQLLNFYGTRLQNDYPIELTRLNADEILGGYDLIVDCFDNAASRGIVQDHARANGVPCLHAGLAADGEFGAVRWDKDFVIDTEDVPGQATCEGRGFLPLIHSTAAAIITSIESYTTGNEELNWNISTRSSDSFS